MFLKRIEMQGFKSFADRTIIHFDHAMTGIVGPNGCGKSNIADAIRWVLGEQSAKSLRGDKMHDVIFSGSADRNKMNMAEVTLVFDNQQHILNQQQDEIEVTRRLYRDSGDAQYLINRKAVRLKDVVDLFLDTGLGKDSLSIISQGNVLSFAESKANERRGIFEEAAGVAKYKKRKLESLSRLERTKANLLRIEDIVHELEKQVSPLKRQAKKAELYQEKKQRLQEIEVHVLVEEIDHFLQELETNKNNAFQYDSDKVMLETQVNVLDTKVTQARKQMYQMDQEISSLQDQLMKNYAIVQELENRRTQLDEKRKYLVETGTNEQKIAQVQQLLQQAQIEFEDRQKRLEDLQNEIALSSTKLGQVAQQLIQSSSAYEGLQMQLRRLENRRNVLEQMMKNPFSSQNGIRVIMAQKDNLYGILGVIGQEIVVTEGYEQAISTALGGAMNYIVTKDEEAARQAIRFLSKNQSGRATFLPLTVCQPRYVSQQAKVICSSFKGYLGTADQFVQDHPIYTTVMKNLLGNVLVVKDMETGNELASHTQRNFKIVTLDGEVIHRGGSMTGGKTKNDTNLVTMKQEFEQVALEYQSLQAKVTLAKRQYDELLRQKEEISSTLQEQRYSLASLESVVSVKQAKYESLKNEFALLKPNQQQVQQDHQIDDLIYQLNEAYAQKDTLTNQIKNQKQVRFTMMQETERQEAKLRSMRKELTVAANRVHELEIDRSRLETQLKVNIDRLSSAYSLTYEYAKQNQKELDVEQAKLEVNQLRLEIERLGNINMNAPQEYEEINARYEQMVEQMQQLQESMDKIVAVIDEMDTIMKKQFKETFDAVNIAFDHAFKALYGGGSARLYLVDPEDILNSGIEIDAQPPGKQVRNNMLFSGGEKSLIALCVLFAILKVKPVPLVILDEVEAALDPANVERFAQYLQQFVDQTQFIIVTHRQGTMENVEVLFGVTMQKQGVSQMLRVELQQALHMSDKEGVS